MRTPYLRHLLPLLLCAAPLAGCFTTVIFKEQDRLKCPEPPPPVCSSIRFNDVTIDTSSAPKAFSTHYLAINEVNGLNTRANEYSVAFPAGASGTQAIATVRARAERERDRLVAVRFSEADQASVGSEIGTRGLNGSVGGGATDIGTDSMMFAAHLDASVTGDYDLFAGTYQNASITNPRRRRISSTIYWDAQPAFTPDGRTLYFSTDRPGGLGGTDIYVSHLGADGRWSEPANVGPGVNTGCDELSPFVGGGGTWLYFSSAGHATVGGYDLFRAPIRGGRVGNAENLGRPINTTFDELFGSTPSNASADTLFYYASNQTGAEGFDIFVLHRVPRKGPAVTNARLKTVTLKGTVRDASGRPVDKAHVTIEQRDPPGDKDSTTTANDGGYAFDVHEGRKYEVIAGSDSTLYVREEVRIPITNGRDPVQRDITLSDTVTFRVNFPFNNATDPYEFTLDNSGLPSDLRWVDMIDRAAEFLKRFNTGARVRFEIVGHTDPIGSDPFNIDLGRRRAEFIRRELVRRGVSADVLKLDTRGEAQPLARGSGEPEEQYHARLRRVELIRKR